LAGKDEFRTQLNDIIVKLSPPNEAAMVRSGDTGIFVSSSCMIVRVTNPDVIDPHYLAGWLTSPMGKGILGNGEVLRRGTFLTKTIPFPPIEKQREAGTTFSNILDATENILNIQDLLGETQTSTFLEFYDKDSPHES
jgi:restriction endonuclease S subunit